MRFRNDLERHRHAQTFRDTTPKKRARDAVANADAILANVQDAPTRSSLSAAGPSSDNRLKLRGAAALTAAVAVALFRSGADALEPMAAESFGPAARSPLALSPRDNARPAPAVAKPARKMLKTTSVLEAAPPSARKQTRKVLEVAPGEAPTSSNGYLEVMRNNANQPVLGIGGKATAVMGYNILMPDADACGISRSAHTALLDQSLAAGSFNTVRVWSFQRSNLSSLFDSMEFTLAEGAKRNLLTIPVLTNMWGDCDPLSFPKQYSWFDGGFKQPYGNSTISYVDYAQQFFRRFSHDPRIAMWQLVNEPDARYQNGIYCPDENAAFEALMGFSKTMIRVAKNAGIQQLLTLGLQGGENDNCGVAGTHWLSLQKLFPLCAMNAYFMDDAQVVQRLNNCTNAGLPTLIQEFGACRTMHPPEGTLADGSYPGTSAVPPYAYFNQECTEINGSAQADIVGTHYRANWLGTRSQNLMQHGGSGVLEWQLVPRMPNNTMFDIPPDDPLLPAFANISRSVQEGIADAC